MLEDRRLTAFLDDVAARTPAPGGGAACAVAVGMAAALAAMAARFSDGQVDDAEALAAEADGVRAEVLPLAAEDAEAYGALLAAFRLPKDDAGRADAIATASRDAAAVPLEIAARGARVARLAGRLAGEGNPNLNGDAVAAALLASAATRACSNLVRINLDEEAEEYRAAARHAGEADAAAAGALAAGR